MPARFPATARALASLVSVLALAQGAAAQSTTTAAVQNSNLDAPLFYQLLIGEMELRAGAAGTAYEVLLDAARKTKDEELFRRATEIALQARAGDQALAAARAWRTALPQSPDAHRFLVQLLIALNRAPETEEPLRSLLDLTPLTERPALIANLPRFFASSTDRAAVAGLIDRILQPYSKVPETRNAVELAVGRAWIAASEPARALEIARQSLAREPESESPALLALELLPGMPAAEAVVTDHLRAKPESNGIRMLYARVLSGSQRYADAVAQLDIATSKQPNLAPAWLTLGALHLELRHPQKAIEALEKYIQLLQSGESTALAAEHPMVDEDSQTPATASAGLTQAWLMLSQAAEQQGDLKASEAWLAKVDNPQRALQVQSRRASLLVRQGKLREARELIRQVPEQGNDDSRAKVLAEVQLLRDAKQWNEANDLLATANQRFPDDVDLLYEQAMLAEKLNRVEEMERLLRRVIELKPDHHHAHNALGYSLADRNVRLPEAKALIQKALEIAPGEPFITDSMGWVEYRMGNREEALRLLRGAYQSRPDPEIAAHLGEVLWVSGQRDEALRVWREARSRDSTNDVLRETLARLQVKL